MDSLFLSHDTGSTALQRGRAIHRRLAAAYAHARRPDGCVQGTCSGRYSSLGQHKSAPPWTIPQRFKRIFDRQHLIGAEHAPVPARLAVGAELCLVSLHRPWLWSTP